MKQKTIQLIKSKLLIFSIFALISIPIHAQFHLEKRKFSFLPGMNKKLNTLIITELPEPPEIRYTKYGIQGREKTIMCNIEFKNEASKIGNILYLPIYFEYDIDELILAFKPFQVQENTKFYMLKYENGDIIEEIDLKTRLFGKNKNRISLLTNYNKSLILKVELPNKNSPFEINMNSFVLSIYKRGNNKMF